MKTFEEFLNERAKPPGSFTKANSPNRLLARGASRPASPTRPKYAGLAITKVYPVAKFGRTL